MNRIRKEKKRYQEGSHSIPSPSLFIETALSIVSLPNCCRLLFVEATTMDLRP